METKAGFADKYFLKEVDLSGEKPIKQTKIEFKSNLSIIIGRNGVGKTKFLEFLDKVINNNLKDINQCKATLEFKKGKNITIEVEKKLPENVLQEQQFVSDIDTCFSIKVGRSETKNIGNDKMLLLGFFKDENCVASATIVQHGIPQLYSFISKPFTFEISKYELPPFNLSKFVSSQPYLVSCLFLKFLWRNRKQYTATSDIDFSEEFLKSQLEESVFSQLNQLRPYLQDLSPVQDLRLKEPFTIYKDVTSKSFSIINLFLEFKVNEEWLPFASLSDGTKRLFYIISEVALSDIFFFRSDWYGRAETGYSRIILIEEPELGIHPHQLRKLMLFLKEQSKTKQIIITTHSPEVLDILEPDELDSIILSYYDKEKGTLLRHLTDKEKEKAQAYIQEEFLSDYWMHSNLEPAN